MFVVYFYDYQECDDGPYGFIGVASESDAQELILSFAEEDSYEDFCFDTNWAGLTPAEVLPEMKSLAEYSKGWKYEKLISVPRKVV